MIASYKAGGFSLTFENGLTISLAFGEGRYGSNRYAEMEKLISDSVIRAHTTELGIWDESGARFTFPKGDTVLGYVGAEGVAHWIAAVKEATSLADIKEPQTEY